MAMKNLTINAPRRLSAAFAVALLGLTQAGLAHATCQGMVLHAHRGSPDAPENALSAIKQAVAGPWDGAETDIQQLRDGYWVIHHDAQVGRTLSLQGRRVADLDSTTWKEIRMKDRKGRVTAERAPFLTDVASAASAYTDKVLNVEIKQTNADCLPAQQAVSTLNQNLPAGNWFLTSIDRRQLQCARRMDANGYMGLIVLDTQALALSSDNRFARANAARLNAPIIDQAYLSRLQQEIGRPVGIHIDINTLTHNPGLLPLARQMAVPVFTYFLGNDREHAQALATVRKQSGLLPSGAIINGQPDTFCSALGSP